MLISKKYFAILMVMIFLMAEHAEAVAKRYQIKSGIVKYKISGQSNGTEEFYWNGFGQKEARHTETTVNIFGIKQRTRSLLIIDGNWAYSYNPKTNTATKINYQEMTKNMAGKTLAGYSDSMIEAYGGKKVGTEKVLGKKCTVYELTNFNNYKVWIWKGLPLKMESNFMEFDYLMEAVDIQENAHFDQAKLTLPNGARIEEIKAGDMPDAAQMQEAMNAMKQMQNSPEYKQAMEQMNQMRANSEFQDALLKAAHAQSESNLSSEDVIRDATRKGIKKAFTGALKSLF